MMFARYNNERGDYNMLSIDKYNEFKKIASIESTNDYRGLYKSAAINTTGNSKFPTQKNLNKDTLTVKPKKRNVRKADGVGTKQQGQTAPDTRFDVEGYDYSAAGLHNSEPTMRRGAGGVLDRLHMWVGSDRGNALKAQAQRQADLQAKFDAHAQKTQREVDNAVEMKREQRHTQKSYEQAGVTADDIARANAPQPAQQESFGDWVSNNKGKALAGAAVGVYGAKKLLFNDDEEERRQRGYMQQ